MRSIGIAFGLLACLLSAREQVAIADTQPGSLVLVEEGAEYSYLATTVELPTERYAAIALFDLEGDSDSSGASAREGSGHERPLVLEPLPPPPAGWPGASMPAELRALGLAPLASKAGSESCNCKTVISDSSRERIAVLYAQRIFQLPPDTQLADYGLLRLRVAYRDGLRAYVNGQLIATRNISSTPEPGAAQARGPEWEEFVVPLLPNMLRAGDNQLSLEVRPNRNAQGARLDAQLSLGVAQQVVRGPLLQRVAGDSATIRFDTDLPSSASVEYGTSESLGLSVRSARGALARHHEVELKGLQPGQVVHYRLLVDGRREPTESFHMPPTAIEPLHFAVYGDMRGGHRIHAQIVQALLQETLDFVVVTGDLVLRGTDEADWQRFFEVARPLLARLPYYPVAGNHDMGSTGDERRRFSELFALWPIQGERPDQASWYSFDISGVHFVMLDSNSYARDEQLSWLESDLQKAETKSRAIFAAVHAGPYSRGLHKGSSLAAARYAPLLRKHGVSLLFSGHDHIYQRGVVDGLHYIVSGGGGAPLYSVSCGGRGRKRCPEEDGMQVVAKEHHYITVSVYPNYLSVCPKRVDKTPLEACLRYPLGKK